MIARLPSFSAKASPVWPKHLARQPGHPICGPACRRAGCLQRAYTSHATEQEDETTELTVAAGRRDAMGQAARRWHHRRCVNRWSAPMPQPNALSRSLVALDQDSTIIAVVEMSQSSWLVAGMLPGIERQPRKKLEPSAERLLGLLHRCRDEAVKAGRQITRIALAFEAGRDRFWLPPWLRPPRAA